MRTTPLTTAAATMVAKSSGSMSVFSSSSSNHQRRPFKMQHLDHIVLKCYDFENMFAFYTDVLGCTVDDPNDVGRFGGALTHLRAGEHTMIDLLWIDRRNLSSEGEKMSLKMLSGGEGAENFPDISNASSSRLDHFCLRIDAFDETLLMEYFREKNVEIVSTGMRKGAEGIGPSIYVKDPEGNTVELKGPS